MCKYREFEVQLDTTLVLGNLWQFWKIFKQLHAGGSRYGCPSLLADGEPGTPGCPWLVKYSCILYHFRVIWRWIKSWLWNIGWGLLKVIGN